MIGTLTPGGAPITVDKPQGNNGTGSLAGPFHLDQYGDGMITAGHVTDGDGYDVYRPGTGDDIGTSREYTFKNNENIDYAFVEMTSDETTNPYICNSDNTGYDLTIGGILTDATLDLNVGTDFQVETQGRATYRTTGTIVDTVGNGTVAVDTTQDVEGGDSGGVLFSEVSSEAYIAGNIIQSIPPGIFDKHNARSTTAETVENDAGGYYINY